MSNTQHVNDLHDRAMQLAGQAFHAKLHDDLSNARDLFRQAYALEAEAATATPTTEEPTRSVLHRSAAALALDAGLLTEAEQMAQAGLAGQPPDDIAEELRGLLAQVLAARDGEIQGELRFADTLHAEAILKIRTPDGNEYPIVVPEGADDIVRAHFGADVTVRVVRQGEKLILADILSR